MNSLLRERFAQVDFDQARSDVLPFIRDPDAVTLSGEDFLSGLLRRLRSEEGSRGSMAGPCLRG